MSPDKGLAQIRMQAKSPNGRISRFQFNSPQGVVLNFWFIVNLTTTLSERIYECILGWPIFKATFHSPPQASSAYCLYFKWLFSSQLGYYEFSQRIWSRNRSKLNSEGCIILNYKSRQRWDKHFFLISVREHC